MTPRPLQVLLSAYACEPDKGSEPGIGWNYALQLARFHEVWVITRANNRGPIEAALRESPCPTLRPVYHDLPRWAMWWKRGGRGVHVYYYLWQASLFFVARRLARQVDFDVVHHITFGRYWVPTPLCLLGRPLVWGPVGGADAIPRAFRGALSLNGRVRNALRDMVRHVAEIDPLLRYCARRSTLALATTPETQIRLERLGAPRVQLMAAVGVPEGDALRLSRYSRSDDGEATFVSIGNLLHWKGFEFGIRAFARAGLEGSRYVIIGDGPERRRLERVALELGVDRRVRFLGRLPREKVLAALEVCHALVHPSMHDSGGWVCLEAMAAGCPVLCLDLAGPAVLVGDGAGIKVPARTREETERELAEGMRRLAGDASLRARMGKRGREIVADQFLWDKRGLLMAQAYRDRFEQKR